MNFLNAIKMFTKKRITGLITESHCELRESCFDGVRKMEARLEKGNLKVRKWRQRCFQQTWIKEGRKENNTCRGNMESRKGCVCIRWESFNKALCFFVCFCATDFQSINWPYTYISACMLSHFSYVWLCYPMECDPPGSSVHRILQARIWEWVAISSSKGSSQPRD